MEDGLMMRVLADSPGGLELHIGVRTVLRLCCRVLCQRVRGDVQPHVQAHRLGLTARLSLWPYSCVLPPCAPLAGVGVRGVPG